MSPAEAARRLVGLLNDREKAEITPHMCKIPIAPWWAPNLEDDATRGIALGMLSRRVGGYVWIEPTGWRGGVLTWDARCQMPHGTRRLIASGASWAEAFVRAWEATPPPA